MTAKQRMSELMPKKSKELLKQVEELKTELNALKVAKVTGGTASKVGKIRLFRKNIARVLTAISHKAREKMRSEIKAQCGGHGLKRVPKQLRAKIVDRATQLGIRVTNGAAGLALEEQ